MEKDYEQLVFCQDEVTGLKAIICIHDTTLGPALGGCRVRNDYESEEEAIEDAMNLARGMTYKMHCWIKSWWWKDCSYGRT